ncbi:stage V sporulation protein AB [Weizmannia acidilactici]|uniref:Stage V sporulation protein AB n=1 Tax=Weizmannia acidilactici TaxID=2607726 RepID=A0A5J4JFQ3_9BACI|nr:stage V sporulation protein AB [Weizmannia acidilactici]GER69290.1 stage V sporulation protein AB [Weizmannia acidilactici]GER72384.1 stage V sporulation protein AB [Weizmannia acidilactici]
MTIVKEMFAAFCGLGGGLVAGCGYVAFLTVLGIVPRLVQLSKTAKFIQYYEWAVVLGVLSGTWWGLGDAGGRLPLFVAAPAGLFCGVFVGMLAAALTEVINVIPIFSKRIGMDRRLISALMAIVIGKVAGSLFQWLYFVYH